MLLIHALVIQSGAGSTTNLTARTLDCPASQALATLCPPSIREPSEARMTGRCRSAA